MMEQALVSFSALTLATIMCVHSLLGQRRLVRPLLDEAKGVMANRLARFILPFAWHLTSAIGFVLAAILLAWAWVPAKAVTVGLAATAAVFTLSGIIDAVGSRGRHIGWLPLTLVGIASLMALALRLG